MDEQQGEGGSHQPDKALGRVKPPTVRGVAFPQTNWQTFPRVADLSPSLTSSETFAKPQMVPIAGSKYW